MSFTTPPAEKPISRRRQGPSSTVDVLRLPPHNEDAEKGLLGSILIESGGAVLADCRKASLLPEDFYNSAHQTIYAAMLALDDAGAPVDDITLPERLHSTGELKQVGGPAYINELSDRIEVTVHAAHWRVIVQEKARRRRLIATVTAACEKAYDPASPVSELAAGTISALVSLERGAEGDEESLRAVVDKTDEMWRLALEGKPAPYRRTIPWPIPEMNEKFEPLCWEDGDELVIICARSGVGKSSMVRQMIRDHVFGADPTTIVQVYLLETKARQLVARIAGLRSEIPYRESLDAGKLAKWRKSSERLMRYRTGEQYGTTRPGEDFMAFKHRCEEEEFAVQADIHSEWMQKIREVSDERLFVRAHTFDCDKICAQARATHRLTGRTDLVVVDYLQIVKLRTDKGRNGYEIIAEIAAKMKELSRSLGCPVIVIGAVTVDGDGMPELEDLRGSKDAGYAADRIIGVHRPAKDATGAEQTDDRAVKHVQIRQIKARDQGVFTLWSGFRSQLTRFEPLDRHYGATSSTPDGFARGRGRPPGSTDKSPRAAYGSLTRNGERVAAPAKPAAHDDRPWADENP